MRDFRTPQTSKLEGTRSVAVALLREHGLSDWKFRFDKARARIGYCNSTHKTISLSEPLTLLASDETIRDTLLHEIAHALVGAENQHNHVWRTKAIAIGCSGNRTCDDVRIQGKYKLICPNGHIAGYPHRRTSKKRSCATCSNKYDERYLLRWELS
jgi:hypothetical protein